jgi:hypothetical protein
MDQHLQSLRSQDEYLMRGSNVVEGERVRELAQDALRSSGGCTSGGERNRSTHGERSNGGRVRNAEYRGCPVDRALDSEGSIDTTMTPAGSGANYRIERI